MYTNEALYPRPLHSNRYPQFGKVGGNSRIRLKSSWKKYFVNFEHNNASGAAGFHKLSQSWRGGLFRED
jgi:hypothetical protein